MQTMPMKNPPHPRELIRDNNDAFTAFISLKPQTDGFWLFSRLTARLAPRRLPCAAFSGRGRSMLKKTMQSGLRKGL
jgi:hypothetical protein